MASDLRAIVASAAIAMSLVAARDARGDEMTQAMRTYFGGELTEGAAFLGAGIGTGFIGISLIGRGDFGVGAASAILPVSAIQFVAGMVLVVRTKGQLADLEALYAKGPAAYREKEGKRMVGVKRGFVIYTVAEIVLVALGGASVAFGAVDDRPGFVGAGVGLATQAAGMLTFDLIASRRASVYADAIDRLAPVVSPVVSPTGIGLRASF